MTNVHHLPHRTRTAVTLYELASGLAYEIYVDGLQRELPEPDPKATLATVVLDLLGDLTSLYTPELIYAIEQGVTDGLGEAKATAQREVQRRARLAEMRRAWGLDKEEER